jgi:hypothetical protein
MIGRSFSAAFAVRSLIEVRFATSGAGSAAYRFSWLVMPRGISMSFSSLRMRACAPLIRSLAIGMFLWPAAALASPAEPASVPGKPASPAASPAVPAPDAIAVNVDQAKLVRLPSRVATIVVGNPLIADVALQTGGVVVVTGKGYGATNFIAMDRSGEVLVDRIIQVQGPSDKVVTVYRGVERESYSCTPICQHRITLGDGEGYFKSTIDQAGALSSSANNASAAAKSN